MAKFKIELYNSENIRNLLQETYMLADEQLIQAQNEINKLANATRLQDEVMESKAKYAKAMNDYMGVKDKAISKKMEIAKLLTELLNSYKNSMPGMVDTTSGVKQTFDLTKIKEMVKSMHDDAEKTKTIELTKK
jgi:hypothetical protein